MVPPMALADRLGPLMKLLPMPRLDGKRNMIRQLWDLLAALPGGKVIFSRLVGAAAPYTSTIRAQVTVLRMGHAEVEMHDRRGLRNHLDSIHAVALVNLAELAGNVALAYSLPEGARFIVSGLEIEYLKKARGTITATGEPPVPRTNARAAFDVPVTLRDASGAEVARAVLHSLVGPTPGTRASEVELAN
jgi:acyl-coenzyme A thioesterase PaaI-like protein